MHLQLEVKENPICLFSQVGLQPYSINQQIFTMPIYCQKVIVVPQQYMADILR